MDTFEIRDEEIDVEEIMRKIRENIKRRKESGAYQEGELENLCQATNQVSDQKKNDLFKVVDDIQRDLDYINTIWDIQNNSYFISSHRPIVGKALVKGRKLVHGEVRRYVDPMIWKQKEFNGNVVRILNKTTKKIDEISQKTIELENTTVNQIRSEISGKVDEQIGLVKSEIHDEIATQVRAVVAAMNQEIENRAWMANLLDRKIGTYQEINASVPTQELGFNNFIFEERFRGSRKEIKQRQSVFVHYFEGCKNVLDIGCGRGEFLELLRENGIIGHGVDVDTIMVDYCTSRGLLVEKEDAVSYLEKIDDKSLDGVFVDQVVEHLEPDYLIKMLRLCYERLNYGYYILIETANPLSLTSFADFYMDMSHKKPIHPKTLEFLLTSVNFREIETKFFTPVADEWRLRKINVDGADERNGHLIEVYNHNIDLLNNILYGPRDYVVIGKK